MKRHLAEECYGERLKENFPALIFILIPKYVSIVKSQQMITLLRRPGLKLLEARLQAVVLHKHTLAPPHFDACRSLSFNSFKKIFLFIYHSSMTRD